MLLSKYKGDWRWIAPVVCRLFSVFVRIYVHIYLRFIVGIRKIRREITLGCSCVCVCVRMRNSFDERKLAQKTQYNVGATMRNNENQQINREAFG